MRSELTAAFVAFKDIAPSDLLGGGPAPGSVYYAYDPSADTYWALADFGTSSTASLTVQVSFQDGGNIGMFRMVAGGAWQVGNPGVPFFCGEVRWFPPAVLMSWAMPATPPAGLTC